MQVELHEKDLLLRYEFVDRGGKRVYAMLRRTEYEDTLEHVGTLRIDHENEDVHLDLRKGEEE